MYYAHEDRDGVHRVYGTMEFVNVFSNHVPSDNENNSVDEEKFTQTYANTVVPNNITLRDLS